jgi:hypothetical protein
MRAFMINFFYSIAFRNGSKKLNKFIEFLINLLRVKLKDKSHWNKFKNI